MAQYHEVCARLESHLGGTLKRFWLESARLHVDKPHLSESEQLNLLFALFLEADMNAIGSGSLPPGLKVGKSKDHIKSFSKRSDSPVLHARTKSKS